MNIRFAHSEQPGVFGNTFVYELTSGFNEQLGNRVYWRGLEMMETGIKGKGVVVAENALDFCNKLDKYTSGVQCHWRRAISRTAKLW